MSDPDSNHDKDVPNAPPTPPNPLLSDIAPDGDIVFIVGEEKARLRVYSQCLRAASPVLNTMFGPKWSEGQRLSTQKPLEIRLKEDDADALRTILCMLHHRTSDVPEILTAAQVLNIAVASDKYDLARALKYVRTHWLKTTKGENLSAMTDLLAAARLFGDEDMFAAQSLELIIRVKGSFLELRHSSIIKLLFPDIIGLLEHRRNVMKADLCRIIEDGKNLLTCCRGGREQEILKDRKDRFISLYGRYSMTAVFDTSVEAIIDDIEAIPEPVIIPGAFRVSCAYYSFPSTIHEPARLEDSFAFKLEALKKRVAICMDCARGAPECTEFKHV
ncbi:hypothetical protein GE09DRAFT_1252137 [Coniochaeta sp. 2T2.1]|nr:hypothetical protein GE09DRAFT_1252137 [Coniochaeta sp. 2T2.1]